ncbi:hypothetical protein [Francisella frigiditurris]|uniref:Uncharacterized protein n=1 Tax=Francisella frigiditurris TaxID=1542390 RepID=A0A1J0KSN3_9GAMM|nr:hypothetical protein [Francisella frigiditurris]APC96707.1 hypothetical protein KX01_271 [Francisella frigiditurris]
MRGLKFLPCILISVLFFSNSFSLESTEQEIIVNDQQISSEGQLELADDVSSKAKETAKNLDSADPTPQQSVKNNNFMHKIS